MESDRESDRKKDRTFQIQDEALVERQIRGLKFSIQGKTGQTHDPDQTAIISLNLSRTLNNKLLVS